MNKNDKKDGKTAFYDIKFSTCSGYDCTGLIPAALQDEAEAEAYEELYPYLPDDDFLREAPKGFTKNKDGKKQK